MAELTPVEELKDVLHEIKRLSHVKKSDNTYQSAINLSNRILKVLPNSPTLKKDIMILEKYNFKGSDASKKAVIEEFQSEAKTDLQNIIFNLERLPQTPPE